MVTKPIHILIFGAGSVGNYIGGRLIQGGLFEAPDLDIEAHVSLLGRPRMAENLKQTGLTLTHLSRGDVHIPPAHIDIHSHLKDCPVPDVIFLCVKSQDTAAAAQQINDMGWRAPIVSWQNGVGNVEVLKSNLPTAEIIPAMVPFNITRPKAAQFHCGTGGTLYMGLSGNAHVEAVMTLLALADEGVIATNEIENYQWGKLIINLNNALNTLMGGALRAGFMNRHSRRALAASWEEALEIIRAANIDPKFTTGTEPEKFIRLLRLPTFIFAPIFNRMIKIDKTARSSMLDDLDTGRASEIDFLQGAILGLARGQGKDAPVNKRLYDAVKATFKSGTSPQLSGRQIWARIRKD